MGDGGEAFAKTHLLIQAHTMPGYTVSEESETQTGEALTAIDKFSDLLSAAMFDEAAELITPEMCGQLYRRCRNALDLAICGCSPHDMIQRILEIAPHLAKEKCSFGFNAIQQAIRIGHVEKQEIISLLLALDPSAIAVKSSNSYEEIPIFTMVHTDPNIELFYVLHAAAWAIDFDDLAAVDPYGNTLLHYASLCSKEITAAIVELRPDSIKVPNHADNAPLHTFLSAEERHMSLQDEEEIFHMLYFRDAITDTVLESAIHNRYLPDCIKEFLLDAHPDSALTTVFENQRHFNSITHGRL